eukprot:273621-Prymnesium_polylepis.1
MLDHWIGRRVLGQCWLEVAARRWRPWLRLPGAVADAVRCVPPPWVLGDGQGCVWQGHARACQRFPEKIYAM